MSSIADFTLNGAWNATEEKRWRTALSAMHRGAPATIAGPAGNALGAVATTAVLKTAGYPPAHGAIYPTGELGESMRDLAQLIKSGVGLRIACLDFGEWDFHAEMGTVDSGRQRDKLAELAAAMAAFATDLGSALMATIDERLPQGRVVPDVAGGPIPLHHEMTRSIHSRDAVGAVAKHVDRARPDARRLGGREREDLFDGSRVLSRAQRGTAESHRRSEFRS